MSKYDNWSTAVLQYWFQELRPADWFSAQQRIDDAIRCRFVFLHEELAHTPPAPHDLTAEQHLAAVILFDQFPRNIYRQSPLAFATDGLALTFARHAIASGFDLGLSSPERQFLYMPFMHSEDMAVQMESVRLFERLGLPDALAYARQHHDVIARFGRFPQRNAVLGRASTDAERAFLLQESGSGLADTGNPAHAAAGALRPSPSKGPPAVIFDVDGVLISSPHERAWREALDGFADPARFTNAFYQAHVAGKPRLDGARAALEKLGVKDARGRATAYAEAKQKRLEALMREGCVTAFADAMRFVQALQAIGVPMAAASASKNANQMMQPMRLDSGQPLLDAFRVNVCGRDFRHGKPDPEIYLTAAAELGAAPRHCLVVEDAPAGIEAARAGGMIALGVARFADSGLLRKAKADLVVASLDEIALDALRQGRLFRRPA